MRVIALAIILLAFVALCAFIVYAAMKAAKGEAKPRKFKPWEAKLEDRNTTTEAWLYQGEYREFFGAVDRIGEGYADRLIDLEMAAEDRARERNTARKVLDKS